MHNSGFIFVASGDQSWTIKPVCVRWGDWMDRQKTTCKAVAASLRCLLWVRQTVPRTRRSRSHLSLCSMHGGVQLTCTYARLNYPDCTLSCEGSFFLWLLALLCCDVCSFCLSALCTLSDFPQWDNKDLSWTCTENRGKTHALQTPKTTMILRYLLIFLLRELKRIKLKRTNRWFLALLCFSGQPGKWRVSDITDAHT